MANRTSSPRGGANGSQSKANMNKSKSFGATFSPGFTVNVNAGNKTNNGGIPAQGGGRGGVHPDALLPDPEFTSPAAVRNYCNGLRALMTGLSFELSMAAEIMKGTLSQVPDPDGRPFGSKMRARKVSRKLLKSADAAKSAAVSAAATYAAFSQEYQEEINRVRHRARPRATTPRIDWAEQ
ncbi:plasmid transfer protein TraA [Streptomyces sp. NBC_01500]|uniref:plasmid transfer protein TraA n=1 Tax=Streptomyces sp. NBC_01500 TaxID=2903886 RepID=UPI00224CE485|nr:plasmid transfer protein TraA [Streptomyces sp. NBC_01500]MCX4549457.1 plasmid transfer protein TraA [Streptomyces sp. NBC_01500]